MEIKKIINNDWKPLLEEWLPKNKSEAIKMLHLLGSITAFEQKLKKECYNVLSKQGVESNHYLAELDITATPITTNKPIYNDSEEVKALEVELAALQGKLKEAKERAGISHHVQNTYYKIKQG